MGHIILFAICILIMRFVGTLRLLLLTKLTFICDQAVTKLFFEGGPKSGFWLPDLVAGSRNRRYLHLDFAPIGQLIS